MDPTLVAFYGDLHLSLQLLTIADGHRGLVCINRGSSPKAIH